MAGTVEGLALVLAHALEPVQQRLASPAAAVQFFEELGLPLPPEVRAAVETAPEVPAAAAAVAAVAPKVQPLIDAIGDGNAGAIRAAVQELVPLVKDAFFKVKALAERVRNAYPADLGGFAGEVRAIIEHLPERLLDYIVVGFVEGHRPILARTLTLLGLAENTSIPATADRPAGTHRELHFDRVGTFLSDPATLLREVYGWGSPTAPLDALLVLERLRALLDAVRMPAAFNPAVPELRVVLFDLAPDSQGTLPTALDLSIGIASLPEADVVLSPPDAAWQVRLSTSGTLDVGDGLRLHPPGTVEAITLVGAVKGEIILSAARLASPGQALLIFGEVGGTRLTAEALQAAVGAKFAARADGVRADLIVDARVREGKFVVSLADADGFLASLLPENLQMEFDLGVRWTQEEGLTFRGGAGLAVAVPLEVELGPARLDRLDLALLFVAGTTPTVTVEARLTGQVTLGPFTASVEGVGTGADLLLRGGREGPPPPGTFDLGVAAIGVRFLAPRGLGLAIEAGPVKGGGFIAFDQDAGRYAGDFQVGIGDIGVDALALLDTKLPGGGFALLVVLRASFPPVQLGFGFTLSSVGGLLALNRRIDVDVLRARIASGAARRILAPEDPIGNAAALNRELDTVFPRAAGVIMVGPTLQLSWVELVHFDLGIFIELPGPTKIMVLGSARATIANPLGNGPLLKIRLNIIGLLDVAKKVLEFDAVLIDSTLMEVLELAGGAAFRLSWGDQPYALLSVGGLHPAYSPAPLVMPPSLTRVAMTRGSPGDFLYLRFEGYFAITTNTLQLGASVEVAINSGSITARGFLGFDALIRFEPFFFQIDFRASFRVRFGRRNLAGVSLRGELSGPGPITFHGRFCIEILFFDICWEDSFSIGSQARPVASPVASAVLELARELVKPSNLSVEGGEDRFAVVEPASGLALPVFSPLGQILWTQSRAPLNLLLQRFEGSPLSQPETVSARGTAVTGSAVDWFAPGSFAELSDADALNRKAFERLDGGVKLGVAGLAEGSTRVLDVQVQQIRLPQTEPVTGFAFPVPGWLVNAVGNRTGHLAREPVDAAIAVADERWQVRSGDGAVRVDDISESQAHQLTAAGVGAAALPASDHVSRISF
ncbi:DUF6603 domain-containing protein [Streptosporangium carneum]|uniref:DUF6603 domain-containing protein n=1 Tax=Streptosporangium carneum TaxID=47481 RepID=A0A9W6HWN7_9ACTN|nr:DUF6603 domain-containing protein [Streptosporangium carneum]GLK07383.1 hypothetical protein GCM10017600_07880 [Streptosporangium carneum]